MQDVCQDNVNYNNQIGTQLHSSPLISVVCHSRHITPGISLQAYHYIMNLSETVTKRSSLDAALRVQPMHN